MWWNKHRGKILLALTLAAVLAAAFWWGGDAPAPARTAQTPGPVQSAPERETPPETETATADDATSSLPRDSADADPAPGTHSPLPDPALADAPAVTQPQSAEAGETAYTCTLSISCATILDNLTLCAPEKAELVPGDGWILPPTTVTLEAGESVFSLLRRTCRQQGIHLEYTDTPLYGSAYIEGIHNLYELDVGELSGWMYRVNGVFPNYGCSRYVLEDGDAVEWVYTCQLGADVGGGAAAGQ